MTVIQTDTVLKEKWTSFVGLHKVPVVYGLTIGEYGKMVNGEKWMKKCSAGKIYTHPNAELSQK